MHHHRSSRGPRRASCILPTSVLQLLPLSATRRPIMNLLCMVARIVSHNAFGTQCPIFQRKTEQELIMYLASKITSITKRCRLNLCLSCDNNRVLSAQIRQWPCTTLPLLDISNRRVGDLPLNKHPPSAATSPSAVNHPVNSAVVFAALVFNSPPHHVCLLTYSVS